MIENTLPYSIYKFSSYIDVEHKISVYFTSYIISNSKENCKDYIKRNIDCDSLNIPSFNDDEFQIEITLIKSLHPNYKEEKIISYWSFDERNQNYNHYNIRFKHRKHYYDQWLPQSLKQLYKPTKYQQNNLYKEKEHMSLIGFSNLFETPYRIEVTHIIEDSIVCHLMDIKNIAKLIADFTLEESWNIYEYCYEIKTRGEWFEEIFKIIAKTKEEAKQALIAFQSITENWTILFDYPHITPEEMQKPKYNKFNYISDEELTICETITIEFDREEIRPKVIEWNTEYILYTNDIRFNIGYAIKK